MGESGRQRLDDSKREPSTLELERPAECRYYILQSLSSDNPNTAGQHGEPVAYVKALDLKAPLDQVDGHTAAHGAQPNKRDRGFGGFGVCGGEGEGGGGRLGGSHAHTGEPFEHLEHSK
jgi:hypothetical protein